MTVSNEDRVTCQQCSKGLPATTPSTDFCNQDCQQAWHEAHPLAAIQVAMRGFEAAVVSLAPAFAEMGQKLAQLQPDPAPQPGWLARHLRRLFG